METQINTRNPVTYDLYQYSSYSRPSRCEEKILLNGIDCGADTVYKAKSKLVCNKKDAYGFRPMSPFEGVEQEIKQPFGITEHRLTDGRFPHCGGLTTKHIGGIPGGIEHTRFFRNQIYRDSVAGGQTHDLLAMRAEANLRQQDINILQFAAFLPSTLKNIASNLKKMSEMLDLLHDLPKLKRVLKREDPRSLYLQWLFVWNQLYRDVVGGSRFLRNKARPIGSLVTGRASNSVENEEVISKRAQTNIEIGNAICTTRMVLSQRAVSVARVTCDIKYARNALGLDNPAYLAWDLVKWSWVIDQIVDIGLFISSLTSLHGLEFLGTSITDRIVNESTITMEMRPPERANAWTGNWKPGFSRRKSVKRVVRKSTTNTVTLRNPFQNNVMITAAVAAALSMKAGGSTDKLTRLARQAR